MRSTLLSAALAALSLPLFLAPRAGADEGMYLLSHPPRELLRQRYNFDLDDTWTERAMKASVRFNNGASGGFVSPDGLVVTNHHVGSDTLHKLSTKGRDVYRDGYYARTHEEELRCPDLELNVLQRIEDVTAEVQGAVKPDMTPAEAAAARKAVTARIALESLKKTGLRSDVVTLYQGGLYHLYLYKKYTDVRLVWSPEEAVANFGGDVDNFEYPRHCLDVCFFRVWEDGKPAKTPHHFRWSTKGPAQGDLVFVSGHPGSTNRLETHARLLHRRDVTLPYTLNRLRYLEALLQQFGARGPEQARMAEKDLYSVANARKAFTGQYQGLLDPKLVESKRVAEAAFAADAEGDKVGVALERVAAAQKALATFKREYSLYELGHAFDSRYFRIARHLVRLAQETAKPDGERLPEYREAGLASLKFQLFSPAPIHAELERVKLAGSLSFLAENLGGDHPLTRAALGGKSPAALAAELTDGTRLGDVAERKKLEAGGLQAIEASDDPMIRFARHVDAAARKLRQRHDEEVAEVEQQAYAILSAARFKRQGTKVPPDATFTLRLAFGTVKGYEEDGKQIPFHTTFGGAFERADRQEHKAPFVLPKRWLAAKDRIDLKTPFNFAATSDTIGGNSGSPVLNRKGEVVGVNFDRNRHGLVRNYVYTEERARHVSVHCEAVLAALRGLYGAAALADELTGTARR